MFTAVGACAPLVCVGYGSNTGLTYQSLYRNCGPSSKFRYTSVRAADRRADRYGGKVRQAAFAFIALN